MDLSPSKKHYLAPGQRMRPISYDGNILASSLSDMDTNPIVDETFTED
jgi:hypothetical protein